MRDFSGFLGQLLDTLQLASSRLFESEASSLIPAAFLPEQVAYWGGEYVATSLSLQTAAILMQQLIQTLATFVLPQQRCHLQQMLRVLLMLQRGPVEMRLVVLMGRPRGCGTRTATLGSAQMQRVSPAARMHQVPIALVTFCVAV